MKVITKTSANKTNRPDHDFRSFLSLLEEGDDLVRIKKSVSARFELAGLVSKLEGKKAVVFDKVRESKIVVASNILGTRKRFSLAVGATCERSIHTRITEAIAEASLPTVVGNPPFQENSSRDLFDLPIVTHFEKDAGPYITSSIVFAKDQERGNQNSSTHRLLRLDEKHLVIRMVEGRHLHKCFSYARDHGQDLKVAIVIGVHPVVCIASAYQAPYGFDEMSIANSLLDKQLTIVSSAYSQLFIPSHAEIVIEGRILKDKSEEEWMVEMLRTYDLKRKQPVFELDTIHFRDNAIFHDILPGFAEHRLLMGLPIEAKLYEGIKNILPTTKAVHLTDGGSSWLIAVIQIQKRLEGDPKNALLAAFALHTSLKMAVVVDEDIDPFNPVSVEYAISTRCQADRGFVIIRDAKGSSLDPSSDQQNLLTTKVGIDATATLLKPKSRFEIGRIPGEENIKLLDYI
jgi:UbiD family decarboxylase